MRSGSGCDRSEGGSVVSGWKVSDGLALPTLFLANVRSLKSPDDIYCEAEWAATAVIGSVFIVKNRSDVASFHPQSDTELPRNAKNSFHKCFSQPLVMQQRALIGRCFILPGVGFFLLLKLCWVVKGTRSSGFLLVFKGFYWCGRLNWSPAWKTNSWKPG